MRTARLLLSFILAFLSTMHLEAADEGLRIVYPPDRCAVKGEQIRLVGLVKDPSTKSVTCQVKGGEVIGGPSVAVNAGAFTVSIRLKKGLNEVSVSDQGGRSTRKVSVFLAKEESKAPEGFSPYFTHSPLEKDEQCQNCHNLKGPSPSYRKMIPSATCVSAQCHPQMGKGKHVHGPVGGGTCVACHNPHGSSNKKIVTRSGAEGCYVCHDSKREEFKGKKVVHSPVASGGCTDCHDPHQSNSKYQLKGASQRDLCFNCHDSGLAKQTHVHTPLKDGECTACHQVHVSPNEKLLTSPPDKICFSCHEDMEKGTAGKYVHKPVKKSCQSCHDPHSSSQKGQLRKPPNKLCADCHGQSKAMKTMATAKVAHPPVQKGECASCHAVHFGDFEKLLKAPLQDICFTCHKDLGESVKVSKFPHGPVSQNDCAACHETHGSAFPRILRSYFPAEFYVSYKTDNYAICFNCHNKDIALHPKTKELTGFRNGDRNLHFVHVNKDSKGRSCKACHEVHSGNQAKHIREEVPFGNMWSYPIRYTPTSTGGGCVVGCHKPLTYDRTSPVGY